MAQRIENGFHWLEVGQEIIVGGRRLKFVQTKPGFIRLRVRGPDGSETDVEIASPALTALPDSGKMDPLV